MNKLIIYTLVGILSIGILISCANKPDSTAQSATENSEIEKTENQQVNKQVDTEKFKTGLSVDLDTIRDPLFSDDIKRLLKTTLDSLANKQEKEFRNVFINEKTADAYMYLFGKDYYFNEIGKIEADQNGRVVVEIRGKVKDGTGIQTPNAYYYFVKNDQNQWSLGSID
ncbi:hypothetical protein [Paenibacillus sp. 8b26]|uniref:hypothetical protein n=1 Tax=Paenibacillus sp. 8b26 TaxID=3424133 RepID=UPI003D64EBA0